MGKSADFSEGIKLIREAHADAASILKKWRDIIDAPGELTLSIKNADGSVREVTIPTIREAINRYLGGVFEQITLTDGEHTVILRINDVGAVELVDAQGYPSNLVAANIATSRIVGTNGTLPINGTVHILGGVVQNGEFQTVQISGGTIINAKFAGTTTITGSTRIEGTLTAKQIVADTFDTGNIKYRKQVVHWDVEGLRTNALNSPTNGDIWTGTADVLEAAGIFPEPTWADCTYTPEMILPSDANIHIYWGARELGAVKVQMLDGTYDILAYHMASWPYKMYEAVPGGYRIRWLPLTDQIGRIHYERVGSGPTSSVMYIQERTTATEVTAQIKTWRMHQPYTCERMLAQIDTDSLGIVTDHRLYRI